MADYTYVTLKEINQFLPVDKFQLEDTVGDAKELELEAMEAQYVLGRIAQTYDVTEWTDASNTPVIVRSLIAMRMAGRIYLRQLGDYGSEADQYGRTLINDSEFILRNINRADLELPGYDDAEVPRESEGYESVDPLYTIGMRF